MRKVYVIDLFCGAGGVTAGFDLAKIKDLRIAEVIACVNHDPVAIRSHAKNYPECVHFTEDIKTLNLTQLFRMVKYVREKDPGCILILWASLECTNFSKAKGGQSRDADSRTLAEHLERYIKYLKPDCVWIENVEEFMSWGPLGENGKPVSKKKGEDYLKWVAMVESYGFKYDYRILNSADFGAHTSRKRYFGQFNSGGLPIVWPKATHSKDPEKHMFGATKKWKPVKECLDFSDEGESIFTNKRIKSERTRERIYAGLIKFIAGGKQAFLNQYNSGKDRVKSIDEVCNTVTTCNRFSLIQPSFISKYYSGNPDDKNHGIDRPIGTITTIDHHAMVTPTFLTKYHGKGTNVVGEDESCSTLSTKDRLSLVKPLFLFNYYSGGGQIGSVLNPAPAIMTNPKTALVQPQYYLDKQFTGTANNQSIDAPAGSIMPNDKHALISARKWVMDTNFKNIGYSLQQPSAVITADRHHHYLVNPQFNSSGSSVNDPCFTLIARMDKKPPYLVVTEQGNLAIEVYETDSPATVKIKEFMALYGITDIRMRMLKVPELLKIQGFPEGYILEGTQTDQKKFIGNSVVPHVVKEWIEAFFYEVEGHKMAA